MANEITLLQFLNERRVLRTEIANLQVTNLVLIELVEELQHRTEQLQNRVIELQNCMTRSTYDRDHFVDASELKRSDADITKQFTPFHIYRDYLLGKNEDGTNIGFQSDAEIESQENVAPASMISPINYLDSPDPKDGHESDRIKDRVNVMNMFMSIQNDSQARQSELWEYQQMLKKPGSAEFAKKSLDNQYTESAMYTSNITKVVEGR